MKTFIIILIGLFVWILWDLVIVGRDEARRRRENDKKFKVRSEEE